MGKQKIFSKDAVAKIRLAFRQPGGDQAYLSSDAFVGRFEELESPDIEQPLDLKKRVDPDSDFKTAVALYESFPDLDALQAASPGFWMHLTHIELMDYMRARFKIDGLEEKRRRDRIEDKWFLGEPSQSSLIHHPLAGLWWGVKLSIDPELKRGDKYALTSILFRNLDLPTRTLGTYELGRLPSAVHGVLGYIHDHPDDFKEEYEAKTRAIMRLLNATGGALQLVCLDEAFFRNQIAANRDFWIVAKKKTKQSEVIDDSENGEESSEGGEELEN